jgi:hypothetical protein
VGISIKGLKGRADNIHFFGISNHVITKIIYGIEIGGGGGGGGDFL